MRRRYGADPLHLALHVLLFLLAGYAVVQIFAIDDTAGILLWLGAAVVLHDAVLWPLYAGANTAGGRALGRASNFVRVPLGLSLVLALAFLATISGKGEATYEHASGRGWDGYLTRWLIVSAALFFISAVAFVVRRARPASG